MPTLEEYVRIPAKSPGFDREWQAHGHLDRPADRPGYSRRVQPVAVRILHPTSMSTAGPLVSALEIARAANAERLGDLFRSAGAIDVEVLAGGPDGRPFGSRLRALVDGLPATAGLVVLGGHARSIRHHSRGAPTGPGRMHL